MIQRLRVMIVDDSALMREILRELIGRAPDLHVVAVASDPVRAEAMLKTVGVDVITLDVEMPRMNGLAFLERLMTERPIPVVMVSSLTARGSDLALRARSRSARSTSSRSPSST